MIANFADIAVTLYVAHHVGDYWVQRPVDATHKGVPGRKGRMHCLHHVLTYVATQAVFLFVVTVTLHVDSRSYVGAFAGFAISGVTHYIADRRTPLKRIASWIPGKAQFVQLGVPRSGVSIEVWKDCPECDGAGVEWCSTCHGSGDLILDVGDNPQLATGLWALDQSWHIFWGVFVAALVMVAL